MRGLVPPTQGKVFLSVCLVVLEGWKGDNQRGCRFQYCLAFADLPSIKFNLSATPPPPTRSHIPSLQFHTSPIRPYTPYPFLTPYPTPRRLLSCSKSLLFWPYTLAPLPPKRQSGGYLKVSSWYCDNVRLCPVQDRRRAHAMHILSIGDKGKPSRMIWYIYYSLSHISHRSQISQFAWNKSQTSQTSQISQISQISHFSQLFTKIGWI